MFVTITSLQLKGPLQFFRLSYIAMKIVAQLKSDPACKQYRSQGFWTLHYTMSLWEDENSLKEFAKAGAHLQGMKRSKEVASEIRTYTYSADYLPNWATAKVLLKKGRVFTF